MLNNDYYSFKKELAAYIKEGGTAGVLNSVWILMNIHDIDQEQAEGLLLEQVAKFENQYVTDREAYEGANPNLPDHIIIWMDAALFLASGSHYWSTFCARYRRPDLVGNMMLDLGLNKGQTPESKFIETNHKSNKTDLTIQDNPLSNDQPQPAAWRSNHTPSEAINNDNFSYINTKSTEISSKVWQLYNLIIVCTSRN